jgi:arsenate reductase
MRRVIVPALLGALAAGCSGIDGAPAGGRDMYTQVARSVEDRIDEFDRIPAERRERLDAIARFVLDQRRASDAARLSFICTHNSRRSHMAQIWAQVAAEHFGIDRVETYSAGTEVTAFNPRAVAALERAGFRIDVAESSSDANPRYAVRFADDAMPMTAFSKRFDHAANPSEEFAAVMVCTDADEACPFVPGAADRFAIPYEDPKIADGTPREADAYDERCRQIAREMLYLFSRV